MFMLLMFGAYESGFVRTIYMRGATRASFILPRIILDAFVHLLIFEVITLCNAVYGINTEGWQLMGLIFCFAQAFQLAMFNILVDVHKRYVIIKIVTSVVAMLCCTLIGAFMANYI